MAEYTVCPSYKKQSQGQIQSEITDDNGDYFTSQVYQKSSGSKQSWFFKDSSPWFSQSSFLFLYLFSILVHCSKTRVNMV